MGYNVQQIVDGLRGGVIESRCENVRYRQGQFHTLHAALRENSDAVVQAIIKDSKCSPGEAETEFFASMDAVQTLYEGLNFEKSLEQEYIITKGKDNICRRTGVGLVGIRPQQHSRFYSVISPVAAAMAAGNSILLELDNSTPSIDAILRKVFSVMDQDVFAVTSSQIEEKHLPNIDLLVDQTGFLKTDISVHSGAGSRSIAILDRSGSVDIAAKAIATARLSVNGTSPYSPALVIVNEYVKEAFSSACLQHAENLSQPSRARNVTAPEKSLQSTLQEAEAKGQLKIHRSSGTELSIVELQDSASPLASMKIIGPYIILLPSTGIMDSVITQRSAPTFLATYLFAAPSVAKFLSEQIPSHASYINQIPAQILIGPPAPITAPHGLHPRYTPELFSSPCPQFITPAPSLPSTIEMRKLATTELKSTGQPLGRAVGFFEQGILIGLATVATVVLPVVGYGLFWAGSKGWGAIKAMR